MCSPLPQSRYRSYGTGILEGAFFYKDTVPTEREVLGIGRCHPVIVPMGTYGVTFSIVVATRRNGILGHGSMRSRSLLPCRRSYGT